VDRFAARCLHPKKIQAALFEGAQRALTEIARFKPFAAQAPMKMEIDWQKTNHATYAALIPGTRRESARTVSFTADDFKSLMNWFIVACYVAKAVQDPVY
jgi:D-amino peptidase